MKIYNNRKRKNERKKKREKERKKESNQCLLGRKRKK